MAYTEVLIMIRNIFNLVIAGLVGGLVYLGKYEITQVVLLYGIFLNCFYIGSQNRKNG